MDTQNTGISPAFPVHDETHMYTSSTGITTMDYFAAAAMQGLLAHGSDLDFDDLADLAYLMARKMLESKSIEEHVSNQIESRGH